MHRHAASALALALIAGAVLPAHAQVTTRTIASGLVRPLFLTQPVGDTRLFVVEQRGSGGVATQGGIRIIKNGALLAGNFLTFTNLSSGSEQGLLGLAFHPDYLSNGWLWVNYTRADGDTVIERLRIASPAADTATVAERQIVLIIDQPFSNHNGGWIAFGPDGMFWFSSGDGGSANDPGNRAQDNTSLLGKMIRLDVDGADNIPGNTDDDGFPADANRLYQNPADNAFPAGVGGAPEVFYTGLRNSWRNSFDRLTGDLWMADVGQNAWEEINLDPAPLNAGLNFGWRPFEGFVSTNLGGGNGGPYTAPLFTYPHSGSTAPTNRNGFSVTGGYVYRGCLNPTLRGRYIFADYGRGWVQAYNPATGTSADILTSVGNITSFGEDNNGEIYIITAAANSGSGTVRIIEPTTAAFIDCNANARQDACDIAEGLSLDRNNNGVPDECGPCVGDITAPAGVDLDDFFAFLGCFDTGDPCGNINGLGETDLDDFFLFLNVFDEGCTR